MKKPNEMKVQTRYWSLFLHELPPIVNAVLSVRLIMKFCLIRIVPSPRNKNYQLAKHQSIAQGLNHAMIIFSFFFLLISHASAERVHHCIHDQIKYKPKVASLVHRDERPTLESHHRLLQSTQAQPIRIVADYSGELLLSIRCTKRFNLYHRS